MLLPGLTFASFVRSPMPPMALRTALAVAFASACAFPDAEVAASLVYVT